jgi:predicted MFS family arabinose efflux permease
MNAGAVEPPATPQSEFKTGWPAVAAAMFGIGLGLSPVPFYTIGMLAPELVKAFGWSFGNIQAGLLVSTCVVIVGAPWIGRLTDKLGVAKVALVSTALFGLAFMGFALSNGNLLLFYCNWAIMALAGLGTLPMTWTRLVNARFERSKGLALGFSLVGTGVFGSAVKPFTAWMIQHHGWRATYVAIGALPLLIALPICVACLLIAARLSPSGSAAQTSRQPLVGATFPEALRDRRLWLIVVAFLPLAFAIGGSISNMENVLKVGGFQPAAIVSLVQLIGLAVIVGRLVGGWLMDRFWAPAVAFAIFLAAALACWTLGHQPLNYTFALASIVAVGVAAGAEFDVMAFLVARYFGLRSYGTIYGFMYAVFSLGAGAGPMVFGSAFDHWRRYTEVLSASAASFVVGGLLLLALGRYTRFALDPTVEDPESGDFALVAPH